MSEARTENPGEGNRPRPLLESRLVPLAAALTVCILGLLFLGKDSLWFDEASSLDISRDWSSMWDILFHHETNMWLYSVLLNLWLHLGRSEFVLRAMSVVFAGATVPVVWLLGRRLFGPRVAASAAWLAAINPGLIEYAQEARGYTLLVFLSALSSLYFIKAVEEGRLRDWAACSVVAALAIYAHLFAVLVLGAELLTLLLVGRAKVSLKGLLTGGSILAVLLCPLALLSTPKPIMVAWIARPSPFEFVRAFRLLAGSTPILLIWYFPLCTIAAFTGWQALRGRRRGHEGWRTAVLVSWLILPPVAVYLLSVTVRPMFVSRYFLAGVTPLVLLAAVGLDRVRAGRWSSIWVAALVGLTALGLFEVYTTPKSEDWRSAAAFVAQEGEVGDAVVFYAYFGRLPFEYYFTEDVSEETGVSLIDIATGHWRGASGHTSDLPDPDRNRIEHLHAGHPRVWLVLAHDAFPSLGRDVEAGLIQTMLLRHFDPAEEHRFPGVRLLLYTRPR